MSRKAYLIGGPHDGVIVPVKGGRHVLIGGTRYTRDGESDRYFAENYEVGARRKPNVCFTAKLEGFEEAKRQIRQFSLHVRFHCVAEEADWHEAEPLMLTEGEQQEKRG